MTASPPVPSADDRRQQIGDLALDIVDAVAGSATVDKYVNAVDIVEGKLTAFLAPLQSAARARAEVEAMKERCAEEAEMWMGYDRGFPIEGDEQ